MKYAVAAVAALMLSTPTLAMDHQTFNQALERVGTSIPAGLLAHEANLGKGQNIAQTRCIACHGEGMLKVMKLYPSLDGQKGAYLVKQLLEFKSGARANPIMQAQAMGLSDADIKDVALWYATQPLKKL